MKFCPKCKNELDQSGSHDYWMCYVCVKGYTSEELKNLQGFDLETAIKTFLVYNEWSHSEDLQAFLEFVKEKGLKIREG